MNVPPNSPRGQAPVKKPVAPVKEPWFTEKYPDPDMNNPNPAMNRRAKGDSISEFLLALVLGCAILAFGAVAYLTWTILNEPAGQAAVPTPVGGGVPGYTIVRLYPQNGDLQTQLAAEVKRAQAMGQAPFVEFDADW